MRSSPDAAEEVILAGGRDESISRERRIPRICLTGEPCRVCHALFAEAAAGRRGGGGASSVSSQIVGVSRRRPGGGVAEVRARNRPSRGLPTEATARIVPPTLPSTAQARAVRPRRRPVQRPRQRARRLVLRLQLGADARRRGGEGAGRRRLAQGGGSVGARRVVVHGVRPATRGRPGARGVTSSRRRTRSTRRRQPPECTVNIGTLLLLGRLA